MGIVGNLWGFSRVCRLNIDHVPHHVYERWTWVKSIHLPTYKMYDGDYRFIDFKLH